ncbi:hypothetical protein FO519_000059 [Halicephalobus sp. NKZ332]|nr:hypothetical protein FO519_000059 [Halicephalobus sp. NKZ332]
MQSTDAWIQSCTASIMLNLQNYPDQDLQGLMDDESKLDALIDGMPQITLIPTDREVKLAQAKSMAECNLSFEPKLKDARTKLSQTYTETLKAKADVENMKKELDKVACQRSLDSVNAVLQAEAKKAEDESEAVAEQFCSGNLDPSLFVTQFSGKRALAHKRKIKSEKLSEILKQQHYNQPKGPQVPPRAPYPENFGGPMFVKLTTGITRQVQLRSFASLRSRVPQIDPKKLYEPEFKDPRIYPEYPFINVRLRSYDFVPLEKFQAYVDRVARKFKFEVIESYAVAAETTNVVTFKPNSTVPDSEIELAKYDRVVRIASVPSIRLPLFLELIQTHAPVGIEITVKIHEKADEDHRYIPDLLLKEKQEELKALDDPVVRKNLGWE